MKKVFKSNASLIALFLLLSLGIIMPNINSIEAEKVTPSIQQNSRTYLLQDQQNQSVSNNPDYWKTLEYERLLVFTPNPAQGGEYISLLAQRTQQRYDQIRMMNIPSDEKALLAKKVYRKSNRKIGKVKSSISRYLRSSSKSF
jgi:hypothetical protein